MSQPEQTAHPPPPPLNTTTSSTTPSEPDGGPLPTPIVTTSKCTLRLLHPSDVPAMQRAADSPAVAKYMSYRFASPYTLEDAQRWLGIATSIKVPGTDILTSYAICDPRDNSYLGGIGAMPHADIEAKTFEVGYWIGEASWGKGIMKEALRGFVGWVFETFPDVVRLEANVFSGNDASVSVLKSAGFVYEGTRRKAVVKHGQVYDLGMYGLLREDFGLEN